MTSLTADTILAAYRMGIFPMADSAEDDELFWVEPERRGIFPLDDFHVPKRLAKTIRRMPFEVTVNTAFRRVMRECAAPRGEDNGTWINDTILELYGELHDRGFAHSVECWKDGELVGGLYGVAFESVFCGESMFTRVTDASKIALVYLVARLIHGGYTLLDAQFITPHLATFGAREISRAEYLVRLKNALQSEGNFYSLPAGLTGSEILQSITQTS
ncbi:leucyl/phenylalanyl-tRNA--protein transferase [Sneathiella chungangensis]|uniref:Leucyl/phenylalanyl-tRNA--protein transferase n=1 Tax=Sneathiella chungangensis TaxID=1418234 RepID=A0A845M7F1_9PROT|nr:leucyl/phenylalanyl-tRNA--protein transferase [Sneathiella chungangensis]MZR20848.1 leucyl/phenylalanyl-tRNA--protein transferase [Sneathiella chungangensis]